jgi:hypothetical protein
VLDRQAEEAREPIVSSDVNGGFAQAGRSRVLIPNVTQSVDRGFNAA